MKPLILAGVLLGYPSHYHLFHIWLSNGNKDVTTTVKTPQDSAVCEFLFQSCSNTVHWMLCAHPPINTEQTNDIMDTSVATAAYAS